MPERVRISIRRFRLGRLCGRRAISALALAGYLAAIAGIPLPAASLKDGGEPFPCQNHACGCRNAAECWHHCCCFTPEQRVSWAIAHHVAVPDYLQAIVAARTGAPANRESDTSGDAPCPACKHATRHDVNDSDQDDCCCHAHQCGRCTDDHESPCGWQSGIAALQCRGVSMLWLSTGAALPLRPSASWAPSADPGDWLRFTGNQHPHLSSDPAVPPPRLA
jgi:hypothetical protein